MVTIDKTVVDIIKDHARVTDTLDIICCAIENDDDMPNWIPVCNDAMITDQLGKVCETITSLRKRCL